MVTSVKNIIQENNFGEGCVILWSAVMFAMAEAEVNPIAVEGAPPRPPTDCVQP